MTARQPSALHPENWHPAVAPTLIAAAVILVVVGFRRAWREYQQDKPGMRLFKASFDAFLYLNMGWMGAVGILGPFVLLHVAITGRAP